MKQVDEEEEEEKEKKKTREGGRGGCDNVSTSLAQSMQVSYLHSNCLINSCQSKLKKTNKKRKTKSNKKTTTTETSALPAQQSVHQHPPLHLGGGQVFAVLRRGVHQLVIYIERNGRGERETGEGTRTRLGRRQRRRPHRTARHSHRIRR